MNTSAVFDCMVFIQGAARPGSPARRCLDLVDNQNVTLFVSPTTLAEVNDVLTRPQVLRRLPTLDSDAARDLIRAIHARAKTVVAVPSVFQYPRDPKDEPYVNLVIASAAEFLVTRDKDLLDLMRSDTPDGRAFLSRFPNLRIVTPEAFLAATIGSGQ
jgi:putative PIN family toxin of toxin-antitoxin system